MSSVTISAEEALMRAERTLAYIVLARDQLEATVVNKMMGKKRGWLWARYYPTADEIIDELEARPLTAYHPWLDASNLWWGDATKVTQIINLAKMGDPVTISGEDVFVLSEEYVSSR